MNAPGVVDNPVYAIVPVAAEKLTDADGRAGRRRWYPWTHRRLLPGQPSRPIRIQSAAVAAAAAWNRSPLLEGRRPPLAVFELMEPCSDGFLVLTKQLCQLRGSDVLGCIVVIGVRLSGSLGKL